MEILTIDYQIKLIQFPNKKIKESVTENEDGSYTIFIDSSLSRDAQRDAFIHAMKHILGDDFSKDNVDEIEKSAHNAEFSDELCPAI